MKGLKVLATGYYVPDNIVTNVDLEKMVDTNDEWITSRTGIKSRHISAENSVELGVQAASKAIKNIDKSKIGLIVCASITPVYATPSNACLIQEALGLNEQEVMSFDISAACSGFVYGLTIVNSLLQTMPGKYALVIGSEQLSKIIDFKDRSTCILFGDGAGAVVVENSENLFVSYNASRGDKESLSALSVNNDGKDNYLKMLGQDVFKFAVKAIPQSINSVLEKANLTLDEIDYVVCHQANSRIIQHVVKKYKCDPNKFFMNLEKYGNTSGASIPLALGEMDEMGLLKPQMKIICVGFGGGLTWGATLMEW